MSTKKIVSLDAYRNKNSTQKPTNVQPQFDHLVIRSVIDEKGLDIDLLDQTTPAVYRGDTFVGDIYARPSNVTSLSIPPYAGALQGQAADAGFIAFSLVDTRRALLHESSPEVHSVKSIIEDTTGAYSSDIERILGSQINRFNGVNILYLDLVLLKEEFRGLGIAKEALASLERRYATICDLILMEVSLPQIEATEGVEEGLGDKAISVLGLGQYLGSPAGSAQDRLEEHFQGFGYQPVGATHMAKKPQPI